MKQKHKYIPVHYSSHKRQTNNQTIH